MLEVPFSIVEREPSEKAEKAQRGETGAKRIKREETGLVRSSFRIFRSAISHALSAFQKRAAGRLTFKKFQRF